MSDPIADMLTRIRNANTAKHDTVDVPSSKMKVAIADILQKEGYIKKYELVHNGNFKDIRITLKYGSTKDEKIISGIKRISKPGLRVYAGSEDMPRGDYFLYTRYFSNMLGFSLFAAFIYFAGHELRGRQTAIMVGAFVLCALPMLLLESTLNGIEDRKSVV